MNKFCKSSILFVGTDGQPRWQSYELCTMNVLQICYKNVTIYSDCLGDLFCVFFVDR
jgi:hypothetical protein